jgi:hypothetical protein
LGPKGKKMAKIVFENFQDRTVTLGIEPWAMAEKVPKDGSVTIEFADHPPPEIAFAIASDGSPLISIVSEFVRFHADGQDWEFKT